MIQLAECLSKGISFVRVDLYSIDNKIYFSEFTFSPCGGMMRFDPEQWDGILGSWIQLPSAFEGELQK